eukprot:138244_1
MALTKGQKIYLVGLQGIGPLILNGGINGAIAYLIYSTTTDPLSLWLMPMPLSGDLFVTTIIQSVLTWILVGVLVRNDIRKNNVSPISNTYVDGCNKCKYVMANMKQYPINFPLQKEQITKIATSTFSYFMLTFILFVIPSFIILAVIQIINKDIDSKLTYMDMVIAKIIYGGLMGLVMTPIAAMCALIVDERKNETPLQIDTGVDIFVACNN